MSPASAGDITVVIGDLAPDEVEAEIRALPQLLRRFGIPRVAVTYGYGTTFDDSDSLPSSEVRSSRLSDSVRRAVVSGAFRPASADLFIETLDGCTSIWFCHDAEIHLETDNESVARVMKERWIAFGYPVRIHFEGKWYVERAEK